MLGHAMDFYIPGIPLEQLRVIGLRLQRGGVGFYPESGSPFVHMDTGGIRMWPRMTREELARVFPDGRTVHIPTDGKPLPGYALALADIRKRGERPLGEFARSGAQRRRECRYAVWRATSVRRQIRSPSFWAWRRTTDEDDDASTRRQRRAPRRRRCGRRAKHPVLAALEHGADRSAGKGDRQSGGQGRGRGVARPS